MFSPYLGGSDDAVDTDRGDEQLFDDRRHAHHPHASRAHRDIRRPSSLRRSGQGQRSRRRTGATGTVQRGLRVHAGLERTEQVIRPRSRNSRDLSHGMPKKPATGHCPDDSKVLHGRVWLGAPIAYAFSFPVTMSAVALAIGPTGFPSQKTSGLTARRYISRAGGIPVRRHPETEGARTSQSLATSAVPPKRSMMSFASIPPIVGAPNDHLQAVPNPDLLRLTYMSTLAERMALAMQRSGITQAQLARAAGVTGSTRRGGDVSMMVATEA
ncbi:MAG: hypothetical protein ACK5QX_03250 [bacterium]